MALLLAVPAYLTMRHMSASGNAPEEGRCIVTFLFLGAGLLFVFALCTALRKTPEGWRYRMRAYRHLHTDPEQAFADATKALEYTPADPLLWKARGTLYDKLDLGTEALQEEIKALNNALTKAKGKLRNELARQVVTLHERLIGRFESTGLVQEAMRYQLRLLDFAEAHVNDLLQFQSDRLGWETGVTLANRSTLRKQLEEKRLAMCEAGMVKAIAYCPGCTQVVEPDPKLRCPNSPGHRKLLDIRYVMLDELDDARKAIEQEHRPTR
jgi:tetratricopeptide (TPR) repeat protein